MTLKVIFGPNLSYGGGGKFLIMLLMGDKLLWGETFLKGGGDPLGHHVMNKKYIIPNVDLSEIEHLKPLCSVNFNLFTFKFICIIVWSNDLFLFSR